MAAISAAVAGGYGVELDVQISHDGEAMVFHDFSLERLTGGSGLIRDHDSRTLERLEISGSGQTISRLTTVLDEVAGRVPVLIDIKNKSLHVGRYERSVLRALKGYRGAVALMVWNPWSMTWFRARMPSLVIGHIVTVVKHGGFWKPWYLNPLLGLLPTAPMERPDFIAYNVELLPNRSARRARRLNIPVLTWAVRTGGQQAVAEREADNLIFEGLRP